jgi:hypothetical protein
VSGILEHQVSCPVVATMTLATGSTTTITRQDIQIDEDTFWGYDESSGEEETGFQDWI